MRCTVPVVLSTLAVCAGFSAVDLAQARTAPPRRTSTSTTAPARHASDRSRGNSQSGPASNNSKVVSLRIDPPNISLDGADARQHILVTAEHADGVRQDVTGQAVIKVTPDGEIAALKG